MSEQKHNFGAALRTVRLKAGLTQELLSIKSGIATKQISNFETNDRKPAYENLQRLRRALECKWELLLG